MADVPFTEGQVLAGKYRVEQVLGSGGSGFVVAAWNLELERRVALKFLHPEALKNAEVAERFRREARAAAKIRSEHVARVIDVGVLDGGVPYIVMEHLEGHDLAEEMSRPEAISSQDAVDFALQAIEALAEAHSLGIVHRDLKPANLFIASHADGSRLLKVLDFGISKSLGAEANELALTRTSTLMGSPLYMSPEQMRSSRDVDTRTDIWSLGIILYEMLAGQAPFAGESLGALCASVLSDVPPSIRSLRSELPLELEAIVLRCLAKNPAARFTTVSELARALSPFGSPASQLHVDRASRILDARAPQTASGLPIKTIPHVNGLRAPALKRQNSGPPTIDSWGRSDPPRMDSAGSKRKRRRVWLVGLTAGLVGALLATVFIGKRRPSPIAAAGFQVASNASLTPSSATPSLHSAAPELASAAPPLSAQASNALAFQARAPLPRYPATRLRPTFKADTSGFGGRR